MHITQSDHTGVHMVERGLYGSMTVWKSSIYSTGFKFWDMLVSMAALLITLSTISGVPQNQQQSDYWTILRTLQSRG